MKFKDLKVGDKLVCLRIMSGILVHFNLKITSKCVYSFSVISDSLDTYTFTVPEERDVNRKLIILENGSEILNDNREYLFETIEECKKFAIEYCEKEIKTYEKTIQSIKSW